MNLSNLIAATPLLLKTLPQVMFIVQIIGYTFLILFFGSIAIKGYRGYISWSARFLGRIGIGFLSLIGGISLSRFIPVLNTGIYKMLQLSVVIGGLISCFILMLSLYLLMHKIYNIKGMKKKIKNLEEKLKKAKEITQKEAEKSKKSRLLDPYRVSGIILIAVFLIIALTNFQGFPNLTENIFSFLGISQADISKISEYVEGLDKEVPPGCVSNIVLIQNFGYDLMNKKLPKYHDQKIKSMIEHGSGNSVSEMYRVEYNQQVFIMAITDNMNLCSATETIFCGCLDLKSLSR
jgi:hypothetical protein